ncbi:hypothetical protein DYU05_03945 [Mucilaginibacter terrenus]|uniref:Uncharacterized protein n=1 Tax=Mucilaginibacter terrenus TaxID=2482727 RepID=A0A3E2NUY7_9SPHI|nr:hypothetical protein [Mucilaginibacter terrenus]RFZ84767.1 hypothetical protein DYU05_03945 [Mucilaginibacter terrenus]
MNQGNGNGNLAAILFIIAAGALAFFGWKKITGIEQALASKPAPGKPEPTPEKQLPGKRVMRVVQGEASLPAAAKKAILQGLSIAGFYSPTKKGPLVKDYDVVFGSGFTDKIQQYAGALDRADREAASFLNKLGTTGYINTTLATINALPDADFIQTLQCWKQYRKDRSFYESNLYKANIDNHGKVDLVNRIYKLNIGW